ncbi:MAG TPA: tannase/feruloyl esterase family alpha/beta hydrolase, partial [Myxococcaceae bacterium]|nr:tannase/feruloyl esterase family alpha/beta hydrolase [Myxococcaceae bacterium]
VTSLFLLELPAHAALDPSTGVLAEELVDVTIQTVADLTTLPQRASNTVHPDAVAVAPPRADWIQTSPVPGVLVRGTVRDDPQARVLIRLPDRWNGKLVVAGSSGTRSEFNGDLVISDFVLQKGYAYASQNKGMQNLAVTDANDPDGCPLRPVADAAAGTPANPLLRFFLLDSENSMDEWGRRMKVAALIAKDVLQEHYGEKAARTYAMGVSNGGYQTRKAIEDYPDVFDGGVDWEGVFWREEGPNFIGEIPAGLAHFPAYRSSGFDPNSPSALAIRAANWPPDLVESSTSLWTLNRFNFWEVTECLYVKELDPSYNPGPGNFEAFAVYDPAARGERLRKQIRKIANNGRITRPLISVHGTLDALIPIEGHARPYKALIEARGFGANYRLYEVQNGNHLESFKAALPSLELIQPHAHRAFELLEKWVEHNEAAPPSQCIPRGGQISPTPAEPSCPSLLVH